MVSLEVPGTRRDQPDAARAVQPDHVHGVAGPHQITADLRQDGRCHGVSDPPRPYHLRRRESPAQGARSGFHGRRGTGIGDGAGRLRLDQPNHGISEVTAAFPLLALEGPQPAHQVSLNSTARQCEPRHSCDSSTT